MSARSLVRLINIVPLVDCVCGRVKSVSINYSRVHASHDDDESWCSKRESIRGPLPSSQSVNQCRESIVDCLPRPIWLIATSTIGPYGPICPLSSINHGHLGVMVTKAPSSITRTDYEYAPLAHSKQTDTLSKWFQTMSPPAPGSACNRKTERASSSSFAHPLACMQIFQ